MVKRLRRPARPSFVGLPCQIRPAAIEVLRLMLKRCKLAPIEVAMRNAAVTPSKARNQLTLAELSSLDAITHGHGRLIDFRRLVDANNLTEVLAKDFKIGGDEVMAATEAAEAALLGCARRIEQTGKIGFSGPELAAMREMLEWHQAQRETASRGRLSGGDQAADGAGWQWRCDGGDAVNELALFAGAGGGILGGHLLGWRTVCAVEWEPYPEAVLIQRQNDGILPPFPVWDDVRTFDGRPWAGRVDVVSGGFPCQDISSAGKGAGLDGEQSGLWSEMVRIIREVRPRYAFVENSPMLTSRGLGRVLGDLAEMGFDAKWGVLGADEVGAPHQRKRIWIVANSKRNEQPREEPCERTAGRVGWEFKPMAWDRDWESALREFRGMGDGMARSWGRTDAIRNGQVPAVAAAAWKILTSSVA